VQTSRDGDPQVWTVVDVLPGDGMQEVRVQASPEFRMCAMPNPGAGGMPGPRCKF
jgi:hypothetical protein